MTKAELIRYLQNLARQKYYDAETHRRARDYAKAAIIDAQADTYEKTADLVKDLDDDNRI